jgi:hypothetical protein
MRSARFLATRASYIAFFMSDSASIFIASIAILSRTDF